MFHISKVTIPSPFILAPLAGYSDLPFRLLCQEFGAGLCVSEMISCHGLVFGQKKTLKMLTSCPEEKPFSIQLFGSDVSVMAKAAYLLNEFTPDLIDINMGCPVRKVTKKGAGAALMAAPEKAEDIILEVVKNSTAPVTVKIRKGTDNTNVNCTNFAKMAENSGAAAVTVHGRTWAQGFTGQADWNSIAEVKKSVAIPVIGNGDVTSYQEAEQRRLSSGCDGIMIGRGALGNPWVFSKEGRPCEFAEVITAVLRHLDFMQLHLQVDRMLAVIKNHIGRYFKNMEGSSLIRKKIHCCPTFPDLYTLIATLQIDKQ